jgi:hypothetical protein
VKKLAHIAYGFNTIVLHMSSTTKSPRRRVEHDDLYSRLRLHFLPCSAGLEFNSRVEHEENPGTCDDQPKRLLSL